MKAIPFLLFAAAFTVAAAPAAKFDLRTLIVPGDGSMIHLRVNTQAGETWRLERTLKNRRWTSPDGTAMEKKLKAIVVPKVGALGARSRLI
jgi:hypothetical protein